MRTRHCDKCGCDRVYLLKGELINNADKISGKFGILCVNCLLQHLNIDTKTLSKENRNTLMRCVD